MKRWIWVALLSLYLLGLATPAAAFEGGGRKPSEAPLITFGERYAGQLNNHESDANLGGYAEVAFYRLPPVSARDQVVINWHGLPFTTNSSFPQCMSLTQGINDFSWGEVYEQLPTRYCENGPVYGLSGSGTARTEITVQETNATSTYLAFAVRAEEDQLTDFETYPYDFAVEAPRHYLGVAFSPVTKLSTSSTLGASVTQADGRPAADGLAFTLAATWSGGGVASYSATTAGGGISFPLALPATAAGKQVTFVASRAADAEYQAATTAKLTLQVEKAPVPPSPPAPKCGQINRRVRTLQRQLTRVRRNANHARGATRRNLLRRKHQLRGDLRLARAKAKASCRTV